MLTSFVVGICKSNIRLNTIEFTLPAIVCLLSHLFLLNIIWKDLFGLTAQS